MIIVQVLEEEYGFDSCMVSWFFKFFYSGIFLEKDFVMSCWMFDFVFKMFVEGAVVVLDKGMQQILFQFVVNLLEDSICLNCKVEKVEGYQVFLENGEVLSVKNIVLAIEVIGLVWEYLLLVNIVY